MSEIRVRGEMRIRPDCLSAFTAAAAEAMALHRQIDGPGTLEFDTYIDEVNGRWIALEKYTDSQAMLAHLAVRTPELNRHISEVADITYVEVYGRPSPELCAVLATMGDAVVIFDALERLKSTNSA